MRTCLLLQDQIVHLFASGFAYLCTRDNFTSVRSCPFTRPNGAKANELISTLHMMNM
jgi:hypothetical protein